VRGRYEARRGQRLYYAQVGAWGRECHGRYHTVHPQATGPGLWCTRCHRRLVRDPLSLDLIVPPHVIQEEP
jgi:hypothetical protein